MKKIILGIFSLALVSLAAPAEETAKNSGSFGLATSITDDGMQFGPAYYSEVLEFTLAVDGSWTDQLKTAGNTGTTTPQGDWGFKYKLGRRWYMGKSNYFSSGLIYYAPLWGTDASGISTAGTYKVGPYISFQRTFPGTPFMFSFFVQPIMYENSVGSPVNAGGGPTSQAYVHIFESGGVGLVYLFE